MGSSLLLFLVLLFPVLLSLFWRSRKQTNLPRDPAVTGQRLHASLAAIAEDYGPLIYLRLGARELVVASSPSAAAQVLKTNDRVLCARYVPAAYRVPIYADHSLIWHARCDDNWRSLRTIFRADLLSSPSLARHAPARERKAGEMARFLLSRAGKEVKIGKNCTVMVNAWAIGRNPEIWKDPLSFSPERFLNCSVDYKDRFRLVVATMVHNFDWLLPGGKQPSELNMDEKLGLVLERKQPLVLIPKPLVG
ncbi:unnamed protein product [Spirodela intermedia]|uniref:Uncharacterized protein n=1 Tax=Spirodela intermedia TaxID=51605 RepID=A0A7I8IG99_SPIIN|nr:unnamed protein product [Spirodela intermedia]CAA6656314.1 unnamed protein product [Spirodela intermedia]